MTRGLKKGVEWAQGGFFFQLSESFDCRLAPGEAGYSKPKVATGKETSTSAGWPRGQLLPGI